MRVSTRRGDIWLVDLKPQAYPEELTKLRPCLVLQQDSVVEQRTQLSDR